MGGVVDDLDAVLLAQTREAVHVTGVSVHMDGNDGLRPRSDQFLRRLWRKAHRLWIDVSKDRRRTNTLKGMAGRNKGERCRDDVAPGKTQGVEPELERKGSVHEEFEIRLRYAKIVRKPLLKPLQHGPVVREPLIRPNLLQPLLVILEVRKIRTRD